MSRRRRHFFEVFHNNAPTQMMEGITRSAPPVTTATAPHPLPPARPRHFVFRVLPQTAIMALVLFVGLTFVSFYWGYRRGAASRFRRVTPSVQQAKQDAVEAPVMAGIPSRRLSLSVSDERSANGPGVFWSLCVWQGHSKDHAWALASKLRTPDRDAFAVKMKDTRGYLVTVGRFPSKTTPQAVGLTKEFQEKIYDGGKPFQSCYWRLVRGREKP